jgi:hypothetical protein
MASSAFAVLTSLFGLIPKHMLEKNEGKACQFIRIMKEKMLSPNVIG